MGVALIVYHAEAGIGRHSRVNIWIPDQKDWRVEMNFENLDLALLLGYNLYNNWKGDLRLYIQCNDERNKRKAQAFLSRLQHLTRLPLSDSEIIISPSLLDAIGHAKPADLNVFPLDMRDTNTIWKMRDACGSVCLFCQDSGHESAIA